MTRRILIIAMFAWLAPAMAGAAYFAADELVGPGQAVEDDAFLAGQAVKVTSGVSEDLFAAGNSVTIDGDVGGDVITAGNSVDISGKVADDIMVAGNNVSITSPEVDDVMAAGTLVEIGSDTNVKGDAYLGGSLVNVFGTIEGNLRFGGEKLVLQPGARIGGDLITYGDESKITVSEGAVVEGERRHEAMEKPQVRPPSPGRVLILDWVRNVVTWFIVAALAWYLLPAISKRTVKTMTKSPWKSLGLGLAWLLLFVPVSILLFITIVGLPLGFALIALTVLILIFSIGFAVIETGALIGQKAFKQPQDKLNWQQLLIGSVVLATVGLVPVIGWLAVFLAVMVATGALAMSLADLVRG